MSIILREFETTEPNIDFTDLSSTITVSGVRLFRDVTVNGLITDNISGDVSNGASFLENPYTSKLNVDVLNQDGSVAYQNFLQDYKSTNFTFTEYDNVNVFGEYEKDFGFRIKVIGRDDLEQTTELFLYGNHPLISGIEIQDASGTNSFSESKGAGLQTSAIGQTGNLSGIITFYNDPDYISFDRIEIYSSTTSDEFNNLVDPNIVLSRPIRQRGFEYSFNIEEGLISDSSEFYLHFVTYGQFGTGDIWTVGPNNFANNPVGSNEIGLQNLQQVTDVGNTTSNEINLQNALKMNSESAEINFLGGAARMSASSAELATVAGFKIKADKYSFNVGSEEGSNEVNSFASVALCGTNNRIFGDYDAIVVGTNNIISGREISEPIPTFNADFNFIGAGSGIRIFESSYSSIVGGIDNEINQSSRQSFIGGGSGNVLAGSQYSVIAGGVNNHIQSSESVQIFGSYVTDGGVHNGYVYLADNENRTKSPNRSDALFIDFINGVDIKTGDLTVEEGITMSGGQPVATQSWVESQNYVTQDNAFTGLSSSDVTDALGYTPVDPSTTGALVNDNDIANFITGISSSDVTDALGYTPLSTETDDQTLDEVLTQGSTSSQSITVGGATINGNADITGALTVTGAANISGVLSIPSGRAVASEDVHYIVKLTQAEYDALTPNSATMYIISDEDTNSPVINPIRTVTSNYTITDNDYTILVSGSAATTVTLPSASNNSNYVYYVKNITTNKVIIDTSAGNIDGSSSKTINQKFESITAQSDGSNWFII